MAPGNLTYPVVCAVVLLNEKNESLLQLRDNIPGISKPGQWVFPGGHADSGEDTLNCAKREFMEETNYRCDILNWLMCLHDVYETNAPVLLHVYWARYDSQQSYICLEGQELEFVSLDKARTLPMPAYLISVWELTIMAAQQMVTTN